MGELYLDDIDRALLQEYRRGLEGCRREQTARVTEVFPTDRKTLAQITRELSADNDYSLAR